jgi:hypothetical protein
MTLAEFKSAPTKERHQSYRTSMFAGTAPEYSTGEVLLASVYRSFLLDVSESSVDLENIRRAPESMPTSVGGSEVWSRLLMERGGLTSPFRHGQYSPLASRQLMPLVPSVARIAGVLGKRPRSRWNPSNLLLETLGSGVDLNNGDELIRKLGEALAVTVGDDLFARFVEEALQQGLQNINPPGHNAPAYPSIRLGDDVRRAFRSNPSAIRLSPGERFSTDLRAVIDIKASLTRRQWSVLVEAILRLGLGVHALWMCKVNGRVWDLVLGVASGAPVPSVQQLEAAIWEHHDEASMLLELGSDAGSLIERHVERYAYARTGLNLLLYRLEDAGVPWPLATPIGYATQPTTSAPAALASFLGHVSAQRQAIDSADAGIWLRSEVGQLFDDRDELRALARCKSGYTKNLFEFARHSLGQIKARDPTERCYDLAYLLAYSGDGKPLPVEPGPDMLVMLVHVCCAANPSMPVSLADFRSHLAEYGLHVPAGELIGGKTGRDLAMLGLVVDSPDAAGGRLLVPPFS